MKTLTQTLTLTLFIACFTCAAQGLFAQDPGARLKGHDIQVNSTTQHYLMDEGQKVSADFTFLLQGDQLKVWNQSAGPVGSRLWDWGDGKFSQGNNPSHKYKEKGIYTFCLTVEGPANSSQKCQMIPVGMGRN